MLNYSIIADTAEWHSICHTQHNATGRICGTSLCDQRPVKDPLLVVPFLLTFFPNYTNIKNIGKYFPGSKFNL